MEKLRQLQKIVQDIKKNDDSILNRLKRFQSEQTANFLKTGRNTLERIKNKPPKVPARDYPGDDVDSAQSSDSEFQDYEDPQGDDDNYEPPPCDKVFHPVSSITYPTGEYLDSYHGRQSLTKHNTPFPPFKASIHEKPRQASTYDEEDYMDPQEDTEDNYIDPSEQDSSVKQERSGSPDVYEVPDMGDSPILHECSTRLTPPALKLPPKPSPRTNVRKPAPCPEPEDECDYEICNGDDEPEEPEKTVEERRPFIPIPLPREKTKKPPLFQKPNILKKDHKAANRTQDSSTSVFSPPSTGFHIINRMPLQREIPCQRSPAGRGSLSQEDSATRQQEEEAGVYKKPWYARSTDRKTAEDALMRSYTDGSYLLRKSSGVDGLQPYTLVVFYNSRVYNIPVRYIPTAKQYALGKHKNGEERFKTISDMIENHQRNALVLVDTQSNTKDSTKLIHAVKP